MKFQHEAVSLSKSFRVLETLTGHKSKVKFGDGFYWYETEEEYLNDLQIWMNWIEDNKCHMNLEIAEDTFALHREPLPDYSDHKIRYSIESLYDEVDRDSAIRSDSLSELKWQLNWPDKFDHK